MYVILVGTKGSVRGLNRVFNGFRGLRMELQLSVIGEVTQAFLFKKKEEAGASLKEVESELLYNEEAIVKHVSEM